MIIAVEGPSAAGKTTWCARQPYPVVPEYAPTGQEPDDTDEDRQGAYWTQVSIGRWQAALTLEQRSPVVLCDGDSLKLHYSWCLARVGAAPWSRFEHELRHVHAAFQAGQLGFADLVLVSIPSDEVLRRHRSADPTRSRSSFEFHVTLREPLSEWYWALDAADPGRVLWSFPADGVPTTYPPRTNRSDLGLLDRLLTSLPTIG